MTKITSEPFGSTQEGEAATRFTLTNGAGASVSILDYGCTIHSIRVPDAQGEPREVCLGFGTIEEYERNSGHFGAVIGRFANRIAGARFTLGGKEYVLAQNSGENHIHGGERGFDRFVWDCETDGGRLIFSRVSPDGEEGYPGTLAVRVAYSFSDEGALCIEYQAQCDQATPLNLTNHAYFNLEGEDAASVRDHILCLRADAFTPADKAGIPTGEIRPVDATPFDFRMAKPIGQDIGNPDPLLLQARGYDHNFIPNGTGLREIAWAWAPGSKIRMRVRSDLPGVQLYTANGLSGQVSRGGKPFEPHGAFCLETQFYPDSVHQPQFPSPILEEQEPFHSITVYQFDVCVRQPD